MMLKSGDRIRLISMRDAPDSIPPGVTGSVTRVSHFCDWSQVTVDWDNGRQLTLSIPPDRVKVIEQETQQG